MICYHTCKSWKRVREVRVKPYAGVAAWSTFASYHIWTLVFSSLVGQAGALFPHCGRMCWLVGCGVAAVVVVLVSESSQPTATHDCQRVCVAA